MPDHILICGAGILGASLAYHLAGRGPRVTVIDAAVPIAEAGGRIRDGWEMAQETLLSITRQTRLLQKNPSLDQSIRLGKRQWSQHQRVHRGEDRGVRSDTKRQGRNGSGLRQAPCHGPCQCPAGTPWRGYFNSKGRYPQHGRKTAGQKRSILVGSGHASVGAASCAAALDRDTSRHPLRGRRGWPWAGAP